MNAVRLPAHIRIKSPRGSAPKGLQIKRQMGAKIFMTAWLFMNWVRMNGTRKKIKHKSKLLGLPPRDPEINLPTASAVPDLTNASAMAFAPMNINPISKGIAETASLKLKILVKINSRLPVNTTTQAVSFNFAPKIKDPMVKTKMMAPKVFCTWDNSALLLFS